MSEQIKRLWGPRPQVDYRMKQICYFGWFDWQLLPIVAAYGGDVRQVVILVSMLQFIVLPYILSIALG